MHRTVGQSYSPWLGKSPIAMTLHSKTTCAVMHVQAQDLIEDASFAQDSQTVAPHRRHVSCFLTQALLGKIQIALDLKPRLSCLATCVQAVARGC